MTPEEAHDFFHEAKREERLSLCGQWSKPVVQKEICIKAFARLLEKIEEEMTVKFVNKYFESRQNEGS